MYAASTPSSARPDDVTRVGNVSPLPRLGSLPGKPLPPAGLTTVPAGCRLVRVEGEWVVLDSSNLPFAPSREIRFACLYAHAGLRPQRTAFANA